MPLSDMRAEMVARFARVAKPGTAIRWLAAKPDLKTMKRDDYKAECIEIRNQRASLSVPRMACRAQVGGPEETRKARTQEANQKIICDAYS